MRSDRWAWEIISRWILRSVSIKTYWILRMNSIEKNNMFPIKMNLPQNVTPLSLNISVKRMFILRIKRDRRMFTHELGKMWNILVNTLYTPKSLVNSTPTAAEFLDIVPFHIANSDWTPKDLTTESKFYSHIRILGTLHTTGATYL
jgi:hypothetical protein